MKKKNLEKNVKRDLSRYLTQEEGKVVKGNIVKLAIALGIIGASVSDADAFEWFWSESHSSTSKHTNFLHNSATDGAFHNSGHASHSSHGSHGSFWHGW